MYYYYVDDVLSYDVYIIVYLCSDAHTACGTGTW